MLLFWLCNSLKLSATLSQDPSIAQHYTDSTKSSMDATMDVALKHLKACAGSGQPLPIAIER